MAYQVSTLKKRPNLVNRVNLGELDIQVRVNTREELLELLDLTRRVTVIVEKFLGEELGEFKEIVWQGEDGGLKSLPEALCTKLDQQSRVKWAQESKGPGLRALARDKVTLVRRLVGCNPCTPKEMLEELSRDEEFWVRQGVARNPNAPVEILARLARDEDWEVRWEVAANPNTPASILEALAQDAKVSVRGNVARHKNTPAKVLEALARSEDDWIRYNVALHPQTPEASLVRLAQDKHSVVRLNASRNLYLRKKSSVAEKVRCLFYRL